MWSSTLNLSPFLYSPFLWLPTKDIQSLWIISLQIPGLWFLTSNIFYPNSSRDYFWQNSCKQQFHKKKNTNKERKTSGLYLCLPGVWALRGGLGAQTDVLLQHSFVGQLPPQHQQIRSVLFKRCKYLSFIQLPAALHHLSLSLISLLQAH